MRVGFLDAMATTKKSIRVSEKQLSGYYLRFKTVIVDAVKP